MTEPGPLAVLVVFTLISGLCQLLRGVEGVELSVKSNCAFPIWLATTPNSNQAPLPGGSIRVNSGQTHTYQVRASGWTGDRPTLTRYVHQGE